MFTSFPVFFLQPVFDRFLELGVVMVVIETEGRVEKGVDYEGGF